MGDIGTHFPDTDAAFLGVDSRELLRTVVGQLLEAGWEVGNVDVTVIAQTPRLSEHISEMCTNIAADLRIETDRVNVKATTTSSLALWAVKRVSPAMLSHC